jgi:hypothetical protein
MAAIISPQRLEDPVRKLQRTGAVQDASRTWARADVAKLLACGSPLPLFQRQPADTLHSFVRAVLKSVIHRAR